MIENFDQVKAQLLGLAEAVNSFKSEAVQMKIIELLFRNASEISVVVPGGHRSANASSGRNGRGKKVPAKAEAAGSQKRATPVRQKGDGPIATLQTLIEKGFFKQKKTIGEIVEHSRTHLARHFRASDFSGKLARLVRSGELTRNKNAENQYEYSQK